MKIENHCAVFLRAGLKAMLVEGLHGRQSVPQDFLAAYSRDSAHGKSICEQP
jgi:hypothetical protein